MKCVFQPTDEIGKNGKPVYRCAICSKPTHNPASSSICGSNVPREPAPTWPPCIHRGSELGTVKDCGCGGRGDAPIATCAVFGHCVPRALGGKAKWREFTEKRPAACATCERRQDA